jgi:hypothetical protein
MGRRFSQIILRISQRIEKQNLSVVGISHFCSYFLILEICVHLRPK